MAAIDLEEALNDPASVFGQPEDVLAQTTLSKEQKIEILGRWQYNAEEEAVALEEGMPGEETDLPRRVLVVLGTLAGPIDVEHSTPSKQHGRVLSRARTRTRLERSSEPGSPSTPR